MLLGHEFTPPYLLRGIGEKALENQIIRETEKGSKMLLIGKAGIGKTRMSIWCAKKFRRHFILLPKRDELESIRLPRSLFFLKPKVILFLDDLQLFLSARETLAHLLYSIDRESKDPKIIATCRNEELERISQEDKRLFKMVKIPEWSDEEGKKLASITGHETAYQRYFDGTPASIVMDLYKRREYYDDLVQKKSSSLFILWSLKILLMATIHSQLLPVKANLAREVSERLFGYKGSWELDIEELERKEFIKKLNRTIQCTDKYLLEVVENPPRWSNENIKVLLDKLNQVLLTREYAADLFHFTSFLYILGLLGKAIDSLTVYLNWNPTSAIAYNNRGLAYEEEGKHDQAIADLTRAIKIDPSLTLAYNNRALAYGNKDEHDLAIADYTRAIKIDPNYALARYNRGTAYGEKDEYDLAIADLTRAIKIDPSLTRTYKNRALAYFKKGEYDLAIADLTKVIKVNLLDSAAYQHRAMVYSEKDEYDLAIADFTQAIKIDADINPSDSATKLLNILQEYREGKGLDSPKSRRKFLEQLNLLVTRYLSNLKKNNTIFFP
ncbi:MAG: tetratricopeptide repeat protein [Candidatus Bathyarchaeota archaeon]|nr:tetratricopeptide repeat protein [Candidatus Bathyarchaeota archaeon]